MRNDITGIILCGGKSTRMQTNKALLKIGDRTVIEIVLGEMKKVFDKVIISSNECNQLSFTNIPIVRDALINRGPLSGIYSALQDSKTQKNFIVTCDLPLINVELIEYISKIKSDKEIIIPTINGIPQRLFGVYNKSLIKNIEKIFILTETDKSVKGSIYELHERSSVELVEIADLPCYKEYTFCNMNTPEDYAIVKSIFEKQ